MIGYCIPLLYVYVHAPLKQVLLDIIGGVILWTAFLLLLWPAVYRSYVGIADDPVRGTRALKAMLLIWAIGIVLFLAVSLSLRATSIPPSEW